MGAMKELYQSVAEVCDICGGYNQMPKRCSECKVIVKVSGKEVLIKPETLKILSVKEVEQCSL